jgi:class 3 adenylate cyclase/tetratricopeptide (TPR) repeat protein
VATTLQSHTVSAPGAPSDSARLAPYVPRVSIEWLRETPEARHKQIPGSLAFVDISGFTALTERLSRKGKVGAEEMNDVLNDCFVELLSTAYAQGAGVIKWGGDAVLLLFDGDGHEARACRAALDMQETMASVGRLRTSSGLVELRMSIGIHSGAFDFFLVGDLHRELVITGPAASTTVAMETVAEATEVAVSPQTAAALDPDCLGETKEPAILLARPPDVTSEPPTAVGDVSDLDLSQFLPFGVREHLLAGGGEAEHRPMTPAFIHFMGADEMLATKGPDALADALDAVIRTVQHAAHEHQVAFFETDIAPSGGKVMLMGGAPRSTGNDEEAMLRAMRAVIETPLPLPVRIGVNWGRIFVGDFGPWYRRTYSVKGDAVNLAARLMAKADPGQVLTTDDVLERSRSRFDTVALEPFQAKGKSEPVQAYVVGPPLGLKDRGSSTSLVGRDRELEVLTSSLDQARRYEGRIVELVAEPGMGKSRLVEELLTRSGDARVCWAQCEEYDASTPYFAFKRLLLDVVVGAAEQATETERLLRQRVETTAPHLQPWLPLLGVPLGLELPDTPETALLGDEFRKKRMEEVTRELLGMILLEPTVLVFDDTHWMDDASSDLLRALTEGLGERSWLVLVTRRDQPTGFAAPEHASPVVIELEPLDAANAAALANAATDELPLLPHEIEALTKRAGGNPLFLTELLAAARQGQGLDELPDSVESLMMARIDRLSPADRRVLRCAAVIGATFRPSLVEAALEEDARDESVWRRLGEFLLEENGGMRFRHALVRDAAYEGLPYRRRRELHERVGETIERTAARPVDEAALLSLHFFYAHAYDKAWQYSRIAGEHAQAIYANVEAATLFERALTAARRLRDVSAVDRARVLEGLGDVRVKLGEFDKAGAAYRASISRLRPDALEEARVIMKQAQVPSWMGNYPLALRWITRGLRVLDHARGADAAIERARLFALYGAIRIRQGRPRDAIKWCTRAVEEGEPVGAREALAHAYFVMDEAYGSLGRYDEAVYSPLALEMYEEIGDAHRFALVLNNMGMFAHFQGRWDDALDLYKRAGEAWAKTGSWHGSLATLNVAEVLADQGRVDEAEELLRDALRVARASRSAARVAEVALTLGRLLSRTGRFEEAHALFSDGSDEYPSEADARAAEALMLEGRAREALALSTNALGRERSLEGGFHLRAMLLRTQGSALLQLGRLEEAELQLGAGLEEARERSLVYEVALMLDALSMLARLNGHETIGLVHERDAILDQLGVVRVPEVPLPALGTKTAGTSQPSRTGREG